MIYPVILAGGSGTRLWPLSRQDCPKQFLQLTGDRSLLQQTIGRLDDVNNIADPIIVCNETHRFLVLEQLREIEKNPMAVILESVGRNTGAATTLATLTLIDQSVAADSDPVMIVMPSDHIIRDLDSFRDLVLAQIPAARAGHVVVFGVSPSSPDTGLGYIRKGPVMDADLFILDSSTQTECASHDEKTGQILRHVDNFVQKPDLIRAKAYVDSGEYVWNSSIFIMRASVWLSLLEKSHKDILDVCENAYANKELEGKFFRPGTKEFVRCRSESIDNILMSKSNEATLKLDCVDRKMPGCVMATLESGWSDVGRWSALWDEKDQDLEGNVLQGDVLSDSTKNSLIFAQDRLVAAIGLEDVVVIETADAVLVAQKDSVHKVKDLVSKLKAASRPEHENQRRVHWSWGSSEIMVSGEEFQVNRITINPGESISRQIHQYRAKHWVVLRGTARVTKGDEMFVLNKNQSTYVVEDTTHGLENIGTAPLDIIEIQSGFPLSEDDVFRFDDD